jgi:hypothetical protein
MIRLSILLILPLLACLLSPQEKASAQARPGIRMFVTAPEGCSIAEAVDTEDLYSFIKYQIKSLWFAREGEKADREVLAAAYGPPMDRIGRAAISLRGEQIDHTCASFLVSAYTGSKNERAAAAAKVLTEGYDELGKMTNQMLKLNMLETMQRKGGGSTYIEYSRMRKRRQEIIENMKEALNVSLTLLIDPRRMDLDGKPDHLILSWAQINDLQEFLRAQFPSLKDEQTSKGSDEFVKQAALIQSFLSGIYKPADK